VRRYTRGKRKELTQPVLLCFAIAFDIGPTVGIEEEKRCQEPFIDKKGKFCWKLEMGRPKRAAIDGLIYHVLKRNIEGQAFLLRTVGGVSRSTSGSGSTRRDAALEF